MVKFNSEKEDDFEEFLEESEKKKISEKSVDEVSKKYEYLESENIMIYSKNLSKKDAEKVERIITKVAVSYYFGNSLCQAQTQIEDIRSEIVMRLLEKAYEPETKEIVVNGKIKRKVLRDKNGYKILKRDENGNPIVKEDGIATSVQMIAFWINNIARDLYRSMRRVNNYEDRYFDLDQQSRDSYVESGENRAFKKSEEAKLAMNGSVEDGVNFKELTKIILDDSEGYLKFLDLSPRKTEEMIEKTKKWIVVNAYLNANSSDPEIYRMYKVYEAELSEEQRELLAECEAKKEETGGTITKDIILKTFYGIKTGINAGSAGKITKFIPELIKMKLEDESPDFLREAGINLN